MVRCGEKTFRLIEMPDEPVCSFALAPDVKAAAESAALFQYPEGLTVCSFLVRKGMEAVQGQDDVKGFVRKGECSHVALGESHVGDTKPICFLLRCSHHVRGIIQAGDIRLWQRLIDRHGQHARAHRHLQQFARKVLRNTG